MVARKGKGIVMIKRILLACTVAVALAGPAFAQAVEEQNVLRENAMMYLNAKGKMTTWQANARQRTMLMRHAKPVAAGTIFYMSKGRLYQAQDRRVRGGMMSTALMGAPSGEDRN
jgi:hypothetical protein